MITADHWQQPCTARAPRTKLAPAVRKAFMSLAPILPWAVAVLGPAAERTWDTIEEGLSFGRTLLAADRDQSAAPARHDRQGESAANAGALDWTAARAEHLVDLRDRELAAFESAIREQFAAHGIDLSTPVDLKMGLDGTVVVDGNHPQRAEIEALLQADGALFDGFRRAVAAAAAHERVMHSSDPIRREMHVVIDQHAARFAQV